MIEEKDIKLSPSTVGLATPDDTPIDYTFLQPMQGQNHKGYGFFKSAYEEFKEWNPVTNLSSGAYHWAKEYAMSFDDAPEGWDPFNDNAFAGIPLNTYNVMRLSEAKNPDQQEAIRLRITEELKNQEYLDNGSWAGRAIGGIGGFITGGWAVGASAAALRAVGFTKASDVMYSINQLTTASTFKSLKPGQGFAKNFVTALPGMYGEAAIYSGSRAITHETIGLDQWWNETWQASLFGATVGGLIGTKVALGLKSRLKVLDYHWDDINWKAEAAEDGSFRRWVAEAGSDSVGAERIKEAQKFVDEGIDQLGESPWFKKVFGLSPVVEGLTSRFTAMREWTGAMYDKGGILVNKALSAEGMQTAEQWMKGYRKQALNVERQINDAWADQIGMSGPLKDTRAWLKGKVDSDTLMMRSDFYEHVSTALRNGDKHELPHVQKAAALVRKHYDELYKQAVELKLLSEDLDPITAMTYLNRVYNKIKLKAKEPEFIKDVVDTLHSQSDTIRGYEAPLKSAKARRKALNAELKDMERGTPDYREKTDQLIKARADVKYEQKILNEMIISKQIDPILVSERPQFSEKELNDLNAVREPIIAKEAELNASIKSAKKNINNLKQELRISKKNGNQEESLRLSSKVRSLESEVGHNIKSLKETRKSISSNYSKIKTLNITEREAKAKVRRLESEFRNYKKPNPDAGPKPKTRDFISEINNAKADVKAVQSSILETHVSISKDKALIGSLKSVNSPVESHLSSMKRQKSSASRRVLDPDDIEYARLELLESKQALEEYRGTVQEDLDALIQAKELNERFYRYNKQGFIRLTNPKAIPKLRRPVEIGKEVPGGSPLNIYKGGEAYEIAKRSYDTILNQNPEQMVSSIFDDLTGGSGSNNPLMKRTLMIPDNVLQPYFNNDITELMQLFTGFMSRKIGAEKTMRQFGADSKDAVGNFTQRVKVEYDAMRQRLFDMPDTKQRAKELKKLDKEFENATEFFKKSWGVYMGNYAADFPETWRPFFENLKNWTAATGLGALPLLQVQDMGNIIRQFGFGPFLQEAVFPMITSMFKGGGLHYAREDLAHADLAITTALRAHADNMTGSGSEYYKQGTFSRTLSAMANKLGNISGSNQITDFFQHASGILSQAKTIESLRKYVKGDKLSKTELERLHILGINKELYANKILAQFDEFKTEVNLGSYKGHLANYEKWKDFEVQQIFLNSIGKEVDMVLVKPNLLDTPFAFKNPVIGSMMMFWSYPFASTNARVIPLLQRPDGQKILSEVFIMSMAAWVNPLREALSGREPDLSSEALIASSITNSGIFGYPLEVFNRINSILDIPGLNKLKSDRFKGKGAMSIMGGAPGSALDAGVSVTNSIMNLVATGKVSESDARRMIKALPFTSVWWGRYHVNAFVESMDLPKNRRQAEGWFGE